MKGRSSDVGPWLPGLLAVACSYGGNDDFRRPRVWACILDFDIIVTGGDSLQSPLVITLGGDRETFDFEDPLNYLRVDDDVWRLSPADF